VVKRRAIGVLLLLAVIGAALSWKYFRLAMLTSSELKSTTPKAGEFWEGYLQARSKPGDKSELPELRCELRPSKNGVVWFSPDRRSHLHFLLLSNRTGLKVYQDWNSWGYFARSFKVKDEHSKTYEITRRDKDWTKNFPSTDTLDKGDFVITDVDLCDETWRVSPKLPIGQDLKLRLVGRFIMQADKKEPIKDLWTGQIESAPVEAYVDKRCVDVLNAERRR
jgi:hypothetical protein